MPDPFAQAKRSRDKITEILNRKSVTPMEALDLSGNLSVNPFAVRAGQEFGFMPGQQVNAMRAAEITMQKQALNANLEIQQAFQQNHSNYLKMAELASKAGDREAEAALDVFKAFGKIVPPKDFPAFVRRFSEKGKAMEGTLGAYDQWQLAGQTIEDLGLRDRLTSSTDKMSEFERILESTNLSPQAKAEAKMAYIRKKTTREPPSYAPSEFERILNSMKLSPEAKAAMKQQWLDKKVAQSGERISVNPETGEVTIERGSGIEDKTTKRRIDEEITSLGSTAQNVKDILNSYQDKFLTYAGKWESFALSIADKAEVDLMDQEKYYLQDYSSFIQDSNRLLSLELKRLSGAAVSASEDMRMRGWLPNPGPPGIMGILKGDSPTTFNAKVNRLLSATEAAGVRLQYMKDKGISKETAFRYVPLEGRDDQGRVILFSDYMRVMRNANPDATDDELIEYWGGKYGKD